MSTTTASFLPYVATTGEPMRLAMQRLQLTGRVMAVGARLSVQHVFRSEEDKPLEVVYAFALPRDAALRAFRITGDGFEVHSELKETEEAVRTYERGIADGSLATLARQYGDGVVNLTVGNVRPNETVTVHVDVLAGVEARDDGFRFRFPFTLAPAYHARLRTSLVGGEGEMELPAGEFGDVILPRYRQDASTLHEVGFDLSVALQTGAAEIGSPSHPVRVSKGPAGTRVALAPEKDVPDRDLVLDVRFEKVQAQVLAGPLRDGARPFAALVPSTLFGVKPAGPRRVAILVDRSGSMQGAPIQQARKAIEACLALLAPEDAFGLIAFDNSVEAMAPALVAGTRENRAQASDFLKRVDARGGTELALGIAEAARMLDGGGDVIVLTDGQVSGTEPILAAARQANVRLSLLGIGSASQDRFLTLLARETGGISRFVTPRERVDVAAVDLFASMGRPVAAGLKAVGAQPEPPHQVFAGTPVLLFGEALGETLELSWDGGRLALPLPEGDGTTGEAVRLLRGSRLITDWESRYPAQEALAPLKKRRESRVAARLVELSGTYGLASREMSLVAVVKRAGDRSGELPETRVVPVGMPQDTAFAAYFGAAPGAAPPVMPLLSRQAIQVEAFRMPAPAAPPSCVAGLATMQFSGLEERQAPASYSITDELMDLAGQLEPDGGMPGRDRRVRAARSAAAVLAFVAAGHTLTEGAFRSHVARLVEFLKSVEGLSSRDRAVVERAIEAAATGRAPAGHWLREARKR